MSASTYFIAALVCNHCQNISPKDTTTELYNKIYEEEPGLDTIVEENDVLEIDSEDISSDFIEIKVPQQNTVKCIELWYCPKCGKENYAEIIFELRSEDARVKSIQSIVLTSNYLDQIHYLSERIGYWTRDNENNRIFSSLEATSDEIQKYKQILDQQNT